MLNQAEKEVYNDWQKKHYDTLAEFTDKKSVYETQFDESNIEDPETSFKSSPSNKSSDYYNIFSNFNPAERLRIPLDSPLSVYVNINFAYNYNNFYFMDENRIQFIKRKTFFTKDPLRPIYCSTPHSSNKIGNGKHIYIGQSNEFNEREGFGAEYWNDGAILYDGCWEQDIKNGFGYMYWRCGTILYCGEFKNNFFDGYGIKYDLHGNVKQSGLFCEGVLVNNNRVQIEDGNNQVAIYIDGKSKPKKTYNLVKPHL